MKRKRQEEEEEQEPETPENPLVSQDASDASSAIALVKKFIEKKEGATPEWMTALDAMAMFVSNVDDNFCTLSTLPPEILLKVAVWLDVLSYVALARTSSFCWKALMNPESFRDFLKYRNIHVTSHMGMHVRTRCGMPGVHRVESGTDSRDETVWMGPNREHYSLKVQNTGGRCLLRLNRISMLDSTGSINMLTEDLRTSIDKICVVRPRYADDGSLETMDVALKSDLNGMYMFKVTKSGTTMQTLHGDEVRRGSFDIVPGNATSPMVFGGHVYVRDEAWMPHFTIENYKSVTDSRMYIKWRLLPRVTEFETERTFQASAFFPHKLTWAAYYVIRQDIKYINGDGVRKHVAFKRDMGIPRFLACNSTTLFVTFSVPTSNVFNSVVDVWARRLDVESPFWWPVKQGVTGGYTKNPMFATDYSLKVGRHLIVF